MQEGTGKRMSSQVALMAAASLLGSMRSANAPGWKAQQPMGAAHGQGTVGITRRLQHQHGPVQPSGVWAKLLPLATLMKYSNETKLVLCNYHV